MCLWSIFPRCHSSEDVTHGKSRSVRTLAAHGCPVFRLAVTEGNPVCGANRNLLAMIRVLSSARRTYKEWVACCFLADADFITHRNDQCALRLLAW
jgi:hypothetical protein